MISIRMLSVAFAAGLAAFAATGAGFAQDDSDKAGGSMLDHQSGGGMMDQKSGGGSMMDHQSGGGMMGQKSGGGSTMDHQSGGGMMGQKSGGGMMGHGMMMCRHGMMGGMRGKGGGYLCGKMTAHIDGRLAFLKAELKITSEQESLWNDYAAAVKDNAKTIGERCTAMMGQGDGKTPSLPERLDAQEQFITARLDGLRAVTKALKPLYAALSDEQKQLADQFIKSSTGMM
jgi:LTXXQ motif family protein